MADPVEIAWAAGLFEGEGSITQRTWTRRIGVRFTLSSTDEDVVRKFHRIVGVGAVSGPVILANPKHKPQWRWASSAADDVARLESLLGPHLGERRSDKLREVMEAFRSQRPRHHYNLDKTHCPRGHAYEGDNILWDHGRRRCRTCERVRWTKKNARVRAAKHGHLTVEDVARKVAAL